MKSIQFALNEGQFYKWPMFWSARRYMQTCINFKILHDIVYVFINYISFKNPALKVFIDCRTQMNSIKTKRIMVYMGSLFMKNSIWFIPHILCLTKPLNIHLKTTLNTYCVQFSCSMITWRYTKRNKFRKIWDLYSTTLKTQMSFSDNFFPSSLSISLSLKGHTLF